MLRGPIRFTNALGGTTDFIYPGPAIDMQSPASAGAVNGSTYVYYAQSLDMSEWEIGSGAYTSASGTFARTTVTANSLGTTAKIDFTDPAQVVVFDTATAFLTQAAADLRYLKLTDAAIEFGAPAQCKLVYTSATVVTLAPFNGNQIKINGALYSIPAAGVTITNAGLAASTLYYCYAYVSAGAVTLEWSTTGHSADATAGNIGTEIKTGDSTRSLVGMVYTNASSQFEDAISLRKVRSWFNDSGRGAYANSSVRVSTTSAAVIELEAAVRSTVLMWSGEQYELSVICDCWDATSLATLFIACWVGAAFVGLAPRIQTNGTGGQWYLLTSMHSAVAGADGPITLGIGGATSSGTVNYDNKITRIRSLRA